MSEINCNKYSIGTTAQSLTANPEGVHVRDATVMSKCFCACLIRAARIQHQTQKIWLPRVAKVMLRSCPGRRGTTEAAHEAVPGLAAPPAPLQPPVLYLPQVRHRHQGRAPLSRVGTLGGSRGRGGSCRVSRGTRRQRRGCRWGAFHINRVPAV